MFLSVNEEMSKRIRDEAAALMQQFNAQREALPNLEAAVVTMVSDDSLTAEKMAELAKLRFVSIAGLKAQRAVLRLAIGWYQSVAEEAETLRAALAQEEPGIVEKASAKLLQSGLRPERVERLVNETESVRKHRDRISVADHSATTFASDGIRQCEAEIEAIERALRAQARAAVGLAEPADKRQA